jgi:hypothetical protein
MRRGEGSRRIGDEYAYSMDVEAHELLAKQNVGTSVTALAGNLARE